MSKQASKALIGGFVLGAVILVATAIVIFGSGYFFSEKQVFVLYFDGAVNGLNVGAPVKFRGVTVGQVKRIILRFDPDKLDFLIPVEIEILPKSIDAIEDRDYDTQNLAELLITQGLRAQLRPASFITGQLLVQLCYSPIQSLLDFSLLIQLVLESLGLFATSLWCRGTGAGLGVLAVAGYSTLARRCSLSLSSGFVCHA